MEHVFLLQSPNLVMMEINALVEILVSTVFVLELLCLAMITSYAQTIHAMLPLESASLSTMLPFAMTAILALRMMFAVMEYVLELPRAVSLMTLVSLLVATWSLDSVN